MRLPSFYRLTAMCHALRSVVQFDLMRIIERGTGGVPLINLRHSTDQSAAPWSHCRVNCAVPR